jgi:hypothetical protein
MLRLWRAEDAMRRAPVIDDKLDDLIFERDSVRIKMSLLSERPSTTTEELSDLRAKVREIEDLIRARQRSI